MGRPRPAHCHGRRSPFICLEILGLVPRLSDQGIMRWGPGQSRLSAARPRQRPPASSRGRRLPDPHRQHQRRRLSRWPSQRTEAVQKATDRKSSVIEPEERRSASRQINCANPAAALRALLTCPSRLAAKLLSLSTNAVGLEAASTITRKSPTGGRQAPPALLQPLSSKGAVGLSSNPASTGSSFRGKPGLRSDRSRRPDRRRPGRSRNWRGGGQTPSCGSPLPFSRHRHSPRQACRVLDMDASGHYGESVDSPTPHEPSDVAISWSSSSSRTSSGCLRFCFALVVRAAILVTAETG